LQVEIYGGEFEIFNNLNH